MGSSLNKHCKLFPEIKEMKQLEEKDTYSLYETKQSTKVEFKEVESRDKQFRQEIQLIEDLFSLNFRGAAKIVNYKIDQEEKKLCVLTEIPKYTLKSYLEYNPPLDNQQIVDLLATIILTQYQFGNRKQYIGFDNIYTDDGKNWKLKLFQETNSYVKSFSKQLKNPSGFPAPEEYSGKVTDINRVAIFGFGLIITQLILKQPSSSIYPQGKFNEQELWGRIRMLRTKSNDYPGKFIEILISMIEPNFTQRSNYQQLMGLLNPSKSQIKSEILSNFETIKIQKDEIQPDNSNLSTKSIISAVYKSQIEDKLNNAIERLNLIQKNFSSTQTFDCLDGSKYKGDMKDGKFDGVGQIIQKDGKTIYFGEFLQGQFHGVGIYTFHNCKLANGKINYRRIQLNLDYIESYEGFFQNGQKCGEGKLCFSNGEVFLGEFQNDLPHGYGNFTNVNKCQRTGRWEYGELCETIGVESSIIDHKHHQISQLDTILSVIEDEIKRNENEIKKQNANKQKSSIIQGSSLFCYSGELVDNQMQGRGITYYKNQKEQYVGEFQYNKFHGKGTLHNEKPEINHELDLEDIRDAFIKGWWFHYDGEFENGVKHGKGKLYLTDNSYYYGEFINDQPNGIGYRKNPYDQYFNEVWNDGILQPNQYLL